MPTTPTLLRPLTTPDLVAAECGNSEIEEFVLYTAINAASRAVEEMTGRWWWFMDHSDTPLKVKPSWVAGDQIWLPWPIITLTQINSGDDVLEADEDYLFGEEWPQVVTSLVGPWPERALHADDAIMLTGTFGYPLAGTNPTITPPPTLPGPVSRAATLIAAAWTGAMRIEQVGLDGQRISVLDRNIPAEATRLLRLYPQGQI